MARKKGIFKEIKWWHLALGVGSALGIGALVNHLLLGPEEEAVPRPSKTPPTRPPREREERLPPAPPRPALPEAPRRAFRRPEFRPVRPEFEFDIEVPEMSPIGADPRVVYEDHGELLDRISLDWPGLAGLDAELAVRDIPLAIDPHGVRNELQDDPLMAESVADRLALRAGRAIRLHPNIFRRVPTIAAVGAREPGIERIYMDESGQRFLWDPELGQWITLEFLLKIVPKQFEVMDWDVIFSPDGKVNPDFRRALTPEETEAYRNGAPPIYRRSTVSPLPGAPEVPEWELWQGYNPNTQLTVDQMFPFGLASGDSARVLKTIMLRMPDGSLEPHPNGPGEQAERLIQAAFPVA